MEDHLCYYGFMPFDLCHSVYVTSSMPGHLGHSIWLLRVTATWWALVPGSARFQLSHRHLAPAGRRALRKLHRERRMETLPASWVLTLLCLGSHLLQAVISTTVIPSCIPGESEDNCTALVQMEDDPRVAQVQITKCSSDMDGYCLHGQCIYLVDMREKFCRCEVGYTGLRCEHFFLTVHQPLSKEYVALTVILIFLFLIITAGCIYYFCRWYKNRKSKKSREEYERVTSGDPVLPQV